MRYSGRRGSPATATLFRPAPRPRSRGILFRGRRLRRPFRTGPKLRIAPHAIRPKVAAVPETIEAEVIEIDGAPPPEPAPRPDTKSGMPDWSGWKARVLTLDRRWWPLWLLLGVVLVGLLLSVGLVVGLILGALRLVRGFLSLLTGRGPSDSGGSIRPYSS